MEKMTTRPTDESLLGLEDLRKSVHDPELVPKFVYVTNMPTPHREFNITLDRETAHRYLTLWLSRMHGDDECSDSVMVGDLLDCKELLLELDGDPDAKEIIESAKRRLRERPVITEGRRAAR